MVKMPMMMIMMILMSTMMMPKYTITFTTETIMIISLAVLKLNVEDYEPATKTFHPKHKSERKHKYGLLFRKKELTSMMEK